MKISKYSILLLACALSAPVAALPIDWAVQAVLDDGTALSGTFDIGYYGYIGPTSITSQAAGPFAAVTYASPDNDTSVSNDMNSISLEPGPYTGRLYLRFADSLLTEEPVDQLVAGASFECQGGYGCTAFDMPDGTVRTRHVVSGSARPYDASVVPEVATWAMLVAGFGAVGVALRRGSGPKIGFG